MKDEQKKGLIGLIWSVVITIVNGLITIFNPATKEVAEIMVRSVFNA